MAFFKLTESVKKHGQFSLMVNSLPFVDAPNPSHSGIAKVYPAKRVYMNSQTRYIFRTIRGPNDYLHTTQATGAILRTAGGWLKSQSVFCFAGGKHQCRLKKK